MTHIELSLPPLAEINKEIERRRLLRSHLGFTRRFFEESQGQPFSAAPFHEVLCRTLDDVFSGAIRRLIINIPPGYGKAIDCDTPMLTPTGWVRAGDISSGDRLLGSNGLWTEVVGVHPQGVVPAYNVRFSDGASVVTCSEHRWSVRLRDKSAGWVAPYQVKTTEELAGDLFEADGRKKWRIPVLSDERNVDVGLPIDPYLLGCWLGDGHSHYAAITTMDADVIAAFSEYDPKPHTHQSAGKATTYGLRNGFVTKLKQLGLIANKHVPMAYMLASHAQRLALLQGLCDTDGTVNSKNGAQSVTFTSKRLSDDVRSLINSIGGVWRGYERRAARKTAYTTYLSLAGVDVAFRLARKLAKVNPRKECNMPRRFVCSIEPTSAREMVCFTVDAEDHLFCAGRDLVVTHNTELAVVNFMARGLALNPGARFIHASYSQQLALDNSSKVRDLINLEGYQALWKVVLKADTAAKGLWRTTEGGHVRAASSGEPITGFRAGRLLADGEPWRFTGCFPSDTKVWTERGPIPIGDIVKRREVLNVWAYDYSGRMALRPVTGWHRNPPNEIVRVTFSDGASVECTPDHKFWTFGRGWVRADSLRKDDRLPRIDCGVQRFDHCEVNPECVRGRLDASSVLSADPVRPVAESHFRLPFRQDGSAIGPGAPGIDNGSATGDGLPCVAAPDLVHDKGRDAIPSRNIGRSLTGSIVDRDRIIGGEDCARVCGALAEGPMRFAVGDILGAGAVAQVGEVVVQGVPVRMADIRLRRALPDECKYHEVVDAKQIDLARTGEANAAVSMAVKSRVKDFSAGQVSLSGGRNDGAVFAPNAAGVADGVHPFVSGDRSPILVERVGHVDETFCLTVKDYHNFTVEQGIVVRNCLIIDDPIKPDDVSSEATRKFINARWQNTFRSRLGDEKVPVIVIMQRLHVDDFTAHLLATSGEQWHVLKLPIEIDGECASISDHAEMIPHGLPNGPLWEKKHTEAEIDVLRLSPLEFAGQYMQEPTVAGGNLFKSEWFLEHDEPPRIKWRAIYVDTAQKTKERNDYSVFEHWGQGMDGKAYLLDLVRGRFEAPELEATAIRLWNEAAHLDRDRWGVLRKMAVEDKVSGTGLIQGLKRKAIPVVAIQRDKDKFTRAQDIVPSVAAGLVSIPKNAPWRKDFMSEILAFPDGAHDDQVDPMMDAVLDMCGSPQLTISDTALNRSRGFSL